MELRPTNPERGAFGAFTLTEVMVSVALGLTVIASAVSFYLFGVTSFASMSNYSDMNGKARHASDLISRDIRAATSVAGANTTQFVLNCSDGVDVAYNYDSEAGTLTRVRAGVSQVLLTGIVTNSLSWTLYQRPGNGAGFEVLPVATNAAAAKFASLRWACRRVLAGTHSDSQSLNTAIIELRNQ